MLAAGQGDCLWIEYGDPAHPNRVLIDGGQSGTYPEIRSRILALPDRERHFDLIVVTHVDSDHIRGALKLLTEGDVDVTFDDIWYNAYRHLDESDVEIFGPLEGEKLSTHLDAAAAPWNLTFAKNAVRLTSDGSPQVKPLAGGMNLTLLSPGKDELLALKPKWEVEAGLSGLDPDHDDPEASSHPPPPPGFEIMGPIDVEALATSHFESDDSEANGSSIAFLTEFDDRRVLLAGDAHAGLLQTSIEKLVPGDRLKLDAFKLPHHGSKYNVSRELVQAVDCPRYLISTNGKGHKHPDREAVARVVKFGGPNHQLLFNYLTTQNAIWDDCSLKHDYGYQTRYPVRGQEGLRLEL
jgi:beta-lactamase superfamily II metal-dependent hydrolase